MSAPHNRRQTSTLGYLGYVTMSAHSEVEKLGAPPPPITADQEASVRRLIDKHLPGDELANQRAELAAMFFDQTTLSSAPEAAPHHPRHT